MSSLLNLPTELILLILRYLSANDICQLRLACNRLEAVTREKFATTHLESINLFPTEFALSQLLELAKFARLRSFVKDLCIYPAIFHLNRDGDKSGPIYLLARGRGDLAPDTLKPVLLNGQPAEDALTFLNSGRFQQQLKIALRSFQIEGISIRRPQIHQPENIWGIQRLIKEGDDTMMCCRMGYVSPGLFARVTNTVLTAIAESRVLLSSICLDAVQVDQLQVLHQSRSRSDFIGRELSHITRLNITVGLSPEGNGATSTRPSLSSPLTHTDSDRCGIFHFINSLASLEYLSIGFVSCRGTEQERTAITLRDLCTFARPLRLRTLRLKRLTRPDTELIPFLARLPRLRSLEITIDLSSVKIGKKAESVAPWKQWLPLLGRAVSSSKLSLDRLVIVLSQFQPFVGRGAEGIDSMLRQVVELQPMEWLHGKSENKS